jgi:hypothetical protein
MAKTATLASPLVDALEGRQASEAPAVRNRYKGEVVMTGFADEAPVKRSTVSLAPYEEALAPIIDKYILGGDPVTRGMNVLSDSIQYMLGKFRAVAADHKGEFSLRVTVVERGSAEAQKRGYLLDEGYSRLILTIGHPRKSAAQRAAEEAASTVPATVPSV